MNYGCDRCCCRCSQLPKSQMPSAEVSGSMPNVSGDVSGSVPSAGGGIDFPSASGELAGTCAR